MQMASQSMPGQHPTWHNQEADQHQRQALVNSIFTLFARRKPDVNQDWQRKLPDFIKRLEEALYRLASSPEEYADLSTLEQRLQEVARRMVNRPGTQSGGSAQSPPFGLGLANAPNGGHDQQPGQMHGSAPGPPMQQQQQAQQSPHPQQPQQQQQQQQPPPQQQQPPQQQGHPMSQPMQAGPAYQQAQPNGYGIPMSGPMQRPHSGGQQAHPSWGNGAAAVGRGTPNGSGPLMQAESMQHMGGMPQIQGQGMMGPSGGHGNAGPTTSQADSRHPPVMNGMRQPQQQAPGNMMPIKQEMNGMMPIKQEGAPMNGMMLQQQGAMHHMHQQHAQQPMPQQAHMGQHSMQANGNMMRGGPPGQAPGSHVMSNGVPVLRGRGAGGSSSSTWAATLPAPMMQGGNGHARNGMMPASVGMQPMNGTKSDHQQHYQQPQRLNGMDPMMGGQAGGSAAMGGMMTPKSDSFTMEGSPMVGVGGYQGGMVPVSSIYSGPMAGGIGPPAMQPMPDSSQAGGRDAMSGFGDLGSGQGLFEGYSGSGGGGQGGGHMPPGTSDANMAAAKKNYIAKQQRWLLFLRHCAKCQAQEGVCQYGESCTVAKQLWRHILTCSGQQCSYPRCVASRELLKHHQKCTSSACPVCTPVKQYVSRQRQAINLRTNQTPHQQPTADPALAARTSSAAAVTGSGQLPMDTSRRAETPNSGIVPLEPPAKRQKTHNLKENAGTSLVEAFSLEEINQHMKMLELSSAANKHSQCEFPDDSVCKACSQNRLTFEPPSLYCTCCGQRIKRNQVYYTPQMPQEQKQKKGQRQSEVKGHWCHGCVSEAKDSGLTQMDGSVIKKQELAKKKNDEEMEEGWVQCDNCQGWVHQICGLFNKGRNDEDMPYQCPACLRQGLVQRQRKPITLRPQSMLEAVELPKCDLSEHLQKHLDKAVAEERKARAASKGLPVESVAAAEPLTVRVVNNVDKVQEVKAHFHEAFKADGFPGSLPFRQKVILLFQRIEGVDVCLYCVYTQEYGDSCPAPNTRWVYLAYIDSVKYFRPEESAVPPPGSGMASCALRTLVYHELLLAYLAYIKARGYTSMFIWACPPLQGDDYILYCHPNKQKTPRSDRLREWYHALLRTAKERGTVTYVSNLYDTFFPTGKDHRVLKPSAAHMPYLEGDYWPGEAETLLLGIAEEQRQAGKRAGKGPGPTAKVSLTPRSKGSAKGKRAALAGSTDEALLQRLGDVVQGMKDDFMVVHFRESCSYCRKYLTDEPRHVHPNPPQRMLRQERTFEGISLDQPGASSKAVLTMSRFQLCGSCHAAAVDASSQPGGSSSQVALPAGMQLSELVVDHVEAIPPTTDEGNPDMESEFFDTRQAFLSLCQGNHYQFDTMRRAKHSSMMVLYHLHNPQAPAFSSTCNKCGREVAAGEGWRCTVCPDYDLCGNCAQGGSNSSVHPHRLMQHARKIDETRTRISEDERRDRAAQLQRTMKLLVHASDCRDKSCASSNCHKIKELYYHANKCTVKVLGGCPACRRLWALLQLHAKQCNEADCHVPRCKELRALRRKQMMRQDDQRRTAYKAMLRNQNNPNPAPH